MMEERCVCCGEIIPEGKQICPSCQKTTKHKCPCEPCVPPKRKPGCHGSCPEYKEWNLDHLKKNKIIRKSKAKQKIINDYVIDSTLKNMRKKNLDQAKRK